MKKALVVVLLLAGAAVWIRGTPQYSYWRLRSALAEGDVATVEEHLDLATLSGVMVDVAAATAGEAAREAGGDLAGVLLGALADAYGAVLKGAVAPVTVDTLKQQIAAKEWATKVGPFELDAPMSAVAQVQRLDQSALVDQGGRCGGKEARLRLVMEKRGGPLGGLLANWKVTGVDKASLPAFVRTCVAVPH